MSTVDNSKIVGKVLYEFDTLDSTNVYAIELLSRENPPEGTVILTRYQSEGRGQMGTRWESEPGANLMLSVILKPLFLPVVDQFELNKAISLAVHRLVSTYFPTRAAIKWPNDIYIGHRKVSGILIQNGVQGKKLQWTVAGIGLNINQKDFGKHLHKATSFTLENATHHDLTVLRDQLFSHLDHFYRLLRDRQTVVNQQYLQALYRLGVPTNFTTVYGDQFTGSIETVDLQGRLVVRDLNQKLLYFNLKEINYT